MGYDLPDVGTHGWMVGILQDMGEAESAGNGMLKANSWQKVQAFCELTGEDLGNRELIGIVQLSRAYANMFNKANGNNCEYPMVDEVSAEQTEAELVKAFGF